MAEPDHKWHLSALEREHTPDAIQERLQAGPNRSYLRDVVYGAIDGTVTTFAVVPLAVLLSRGR